MTCNATRRGLLPARFLRFAALLLVVSCEAHVPVVRDHSNECSQLAQPCHLCQTNHLRMYMQFVPWMFVLILCIFSYFVRSFSLPCRVLRPIASCSMIAICICLILTGNSEALATPAVRSHSHECHQLANRCHDTLVQISHTFTPPSFWENLDDTILDPSFLSSFRSCRVGEASHPGPLNFRLAVTNPISIVSKEIQYRALRHDHHVHIAIAAETAATVKGQRVFRHMMAPDFSKIIWSPPVPEKRECSDGRESLRGQAAGVAILSTFPIRQAVGTLHQTHQQTSRLVHTIVNIGSVQLQIFAIYAYTPGGHSQANSFNAELLHAALDASTHLALPTLIVGDFNGNPFQWGTGSRLHALGFQDLVQLHPALHQCQMPATCRDVTRPDNALLCPKAANLLRHIQVLRNHMFDCHQPVLLDFQVDAAAGFEQRLPMPKSFLELPIDLDLLPATYDQVIQTHGKPTSLEEWGKTVEQAVDSAYRQTQMAEPDNPQQPRGLPRAFRGRCQPVTHQKVPLQALLKKGRPNDYNPLQEVHTIQGMRMTKQVRRLQSVLRAIQRTQPAWHTITLEWQACVNDTSFYGSFAGWCQWQPEIGPLPIHIPSVDMLQTMYQMAKHETDMKLAADHRVWLLKTAYRRYLDKHNGNKRAFALLRHTNPPVTELATTITQDGILVKHVDHAVIYVPDGMAFKTDMRISVADSTCHLLAQEPTHLTVDTSVAVPEGDVTVQQTQVAYTPATVAAELNQFWLPYWTVPNPNDVDPTALQEALQHLPADVLTDIQPYDLELWLDCVRQLKTHSARGVDGISAAELKSLPPRAIEHLMETMQSYSDGFPSWLMMAKTYPVPKVKGQLGPSQTRPITVLAQTFRLWSQTLSRCILRRMANTFPKEITGFLPGRSSLDACYAQQRRIERSRTQGTSFSGCCLDLIKCFNTIRRQVPLEALAHMGLARSHLQMWSASMHHLQRTWILGAFASDPVSVNNGLCEGDSFSVVGMLSLGMLWVSSVRHQDRISEMSAFADNWSWASTDARRHMILATTTDAITRLAGMQIDWNKSWIWSTAKQHLPALQRALAQITDTQQIRRLTHEMDLGCMFQFCGSHRLGKYAKRLQEGTRRLQVLQQMPHDMDT